MLLGNRISGLLLERCPHALASKIMMVATNLKSDVRILVFYMFFGCSNITFGLLEPAQDELILILRIKNQPDRYWSSLGLGLAL